MAQQERPRHPDDYLRTLVPSQRQAYDDLRKNLADSFEMVTTMKHRLREIETKAPQLTTSERLETGSEFLEVENHRWTVRSHLARLDKSDILLCENRAEGEARFAIVERFPEESAYAQANHSCEVLLTGNDPRALLQQYVHNERQTLRLSATDIVATAGEIMAERLPREDVRPILDALWLNLTADLAVRSIRQTHEPDSPNRHRRGIGI